MSSDEYFEDDFDSSFLNELNAIEAAHTSRTVAGTRPPGPVATAPSTSSKPPSKSSTKPPSRTSSKSILKPSSLSKAATSSNTVFAVKPPPQPPSASRATRQATPPNVIELDDSSDFDAAFDDIEFNDEALASIDRQVKHAYSTIDRRDGQPSAGPSKPNSLVRRPSKGAQLTLFGDVAQEMDPSKSPAESNRRTFQRTRSTLRQMPLPGQAKRTKTWDRTAYAKSGWRKPKDKGKERACDEDEEEEQVEFEQFPAPEIPVGPAPPMKLSADRLAAKTWIYPLNKPKRDYQYNIVKNCLLENTLVALPTGLGKTFIAGVVMLNFYNWFPQGKVVFVAPTKPLVAQQIDACHKTCGIPGSVAAELTGSVSTGRRTDAWKSKRVFYATPQTLLNDLIRGNVDALDIVLIVIDEAHRGTGDYAYAQVVRYMMQHNPHFRILALTATPGGKPEAVQEIVDALHISHIEIRSESDPDLKKYLHTKFEQEHFVQMTEDIAVLRDGLAAIIHPILKRVQGAGYLKHGNVIPTMLHPFRCQATLGEMSKARAPQYAIAAAAQLGPLARAMGYLIEMSTSMCYGYLKEIREGDTAGKKAIRKMDTFTNLMRKFDEQAARGFSIHPKMDLLRTLLVDHFVKQTADGENNPSVVHSQSRAMVFVSFRECVEEIVELLNKHSPIIRAKAFIGQGIDKQGKKGYAQKEQLEVIDQFKKGVHNILVSTSIGEEGLDIGEVDLIVCYDAQKTPIRMLQRIGRTGRKASGTVHVLLAQGREETNWQKAQSNYAEVQHFIVRASDLEVYGDVDRLIPDDIDPECVEMEMEIEEYVREERTSRKSSLANGGSPKSKKRRRDDDPMRNVPAAAAKGFVSVKDLLIKGASKRKKKLPDISEVDLEHADESDSDDAEIEAGLYGPRRTKSAPSASETKRGKKKQLVRSATAAGPSKSKKASSTRKAKGLATRRLDVASADDSDDEAIEQGPLDLKIASNIIEDSVVHSSIMLQRPQLAKSLLPRSSSPDIPLKDSTVIDLSSSSEAELGPTADTMICSPSLARASISTDCRSTREDSPDIPLQSSSRAGSSRGQSLSRPLKRSSLPPERSQTPSSPSTPADGPPAVADDNMAWLVEEDDDDIFTQGAPTSPPRDNILPRSTCTNEPLFLGSSPPPVTWAGNQPSLLLSVPPLNASASSSAGILSTAGPPSQKRNMGPPALPARFGSSSSTPATLLFDEPESPDVSFAVRAPGRSSPSPSDDCGPPPSTFMVRPPGPPTRKRRASDVLELESSSPAVAQGEYRRLRRERPTSPSAPTATPESPTRPRRKRRKFRDAADAQRHNPWIDVEAAHSGEELSAGSDGGGGDGADDDVPDSDDRRFLEAPPETQVPAAYDQSAVYRQSLLTQAQGGAGPAFGRGPARRGMVSFGPNVGGRYARRAWSPPTPAGEEEPDEYVHGSFVVDDDAEISFEGAPSSDDF